MLNRRVNICRRCTKERAKCMIHFQLRRKMHREFRSFENCFPSAAAAFPSHMPSSSIITKLSPRFFLNILRSVLSLPEAIKHNCGREEWNDLKEATSSNSINYWSQKFCYNLKVLVRFTLQNNDQKSSDAKHARRKLPSFLNISIIALALVSLSQFNQ